LFTLSRLVDDFFVKAEEEVQEALTPQQKQALLQAAKEEIMSGR
jgi:hypothetical protein